MNTDKQLDMTKAEMAEMINELLEPSTAQLKEGMSSADAEMIYTPEEPCMMDLAQSSASQKSDEFDSTEEMLKLLDFQNVLAQGPEDQAPEGKSAADINFDQNMLPYINFDQNHPAQALEAEAPSSAGPRHRYNLTELDGAPVNARMSMPGESRHSYSLPLDTRSGDGSQAFAQLQMVGMSPADAEKAMMDKTLAKLALSNPKSVKRTWSNRQSARNSKIRRAEQQAKLETQKKTLQNQRDTLVDQQALCKKDMDGLISENIKLRSNVEVIEQQNRMLDSWNNDLRMVVNRLRIETGQVVPNSGPPGMMLPFGVPHNFALNSHQQAAQAHARMQQQQPGLVPPSWTNVASGEGADAAGSDAEGGDDVPGHPK